MKVLVAAQNLITSGQPRGVQRCAGQLAYALNQRSDVELDVALYFQAADGLLYTLSLPYSDYFAAFAQKEEPGPEAPPPPQQPQMPFLGRVMLAAGEKFPFLVSLGKKLDFNGWLKKIHGRYWVMKLNTHNYQNHQTAAEVFSSSEWRDVDYYDAVLSFEYAESLWEQPWCLGRSIKRFCIIHDIIFAHMAQNDFNFLYRHLDVLERVVHRLDGVLCDSRATQNDLFTILPRLENLPSQVAYLGSSASDARQLIFDGQAPKTDFLKKQADAFHIFMLGDMDRRKNMHGALAAIPILARANPNLKISLSIVGNTASLDSMGALTAAAQAVAKVTYHGYLSDEDVAAMYRTSDVLLYPSLYEGFGIPILEAYNYGLPVVTSGVSSMPEVAGDLGIYVDPCDPASIARGLLKTAEMGRAERREFARKAKARALEFTYDRMAEDAVTLMDRVCFGA